MEAIDIRSIIRATVEEVLRQQKTINDLRSQVAQLKKDAESVQEDNFQLQERLCRTLESRLYGE